MSTSDNRKAESGRRRPIPDSGASSFIEGLPAIQPREEPTDAASAQAPQPRFAAEDVVRHFATHPVPTLPSTGDAPVVTKVRFTTVQEYGAATGEEYGRPDTALLCYVELRGTFWVRIPPLLHAQPMEAVFIDEASVVFDAVTGNLLSVGSSQQLP